MKRRRPPATLAGKIMNCAIWIPDEHGGWKCGTYGRVCETDPKGQCAPIPKKSKQVKVCVETQQIYSRALKKHVGRCKTYAAACTGSACMSFSKEYPGGSTERTKPSPSEITSRAQWLADEYNETHFTREPHLARAILERGGIAPYRKGIEKEEYKAIPIFMRNKRGLPLDEMAAELNYADTSALRRDIQKAYPIKAKGSWRKEDRKIAADFIEDAYEIIEEEIMAEAEIPF